MDRHQDVTALLANRLKPLVRVAPRDSFGSDSYSLDDHSPVPLKYAEDDDRRSTSHRHHHPFSAQTHFASEDEDSYIEDADDSQDTQSSRMSVMGPKIHKNGNAPWEEMDGLAEEPEDYDRPSTPATSIFGKRPKHSRKGSASTTSGLRQRSKTVVEALSPVGALKGLGFAVGAAASAATSAPASGRSSRNNSVAPSLSKPRPSFQSQSSSSAAGGLYDDDKRSVNTVVDGYNHYPSARQRSRSRPRQETTYADGTIPIDLTGRDSTSFSTSSSSFSDDDSSRPPPLPQTSKSPLRIATDVHNSHHHSHTDSIVRPEDVFRTSVASINSEYGQRLHPYSNIDARTASTSPTSPVAFSSDWASSPSPLEPSRSPAGTLDDSQSSDNNWLDSPSGYGRSAAAGHFDRSRSNGATPLSSKANNRSTASSSSSSRKKPPPLTLHPSASSTSISTLAKGGSGGLIPPPPLPTTPVSPSTASGITRSPTPNSEALYRSEDIPATKPLNISRKAVPQQENDASDYHQGASFTSRSNNHPSTMASTTESSLPFPSTPQQHQQTGDVPPGMLVFPGSPAYGLISLEQAQAKMRGSGPAGRSLSGDVKGKKEGLGGFVARMRLGSEDKAAALGGASESPISPPCGSGSAQESSIKTPGSSGGAQTATTNARQPVLRQRKSGFLKIFGGGGDKTSVAPPMPTSPVPRSAGTMISSPMLVGVTDDGLPSPFAPGDAGNRKPMALRDIAGRQGSVSSPSPQVSGRQSNSSSSPPQSFQGRPSVASQGRPSATPSSTSRLKETGLTVFGDEETRSRERSGTASTVHSPYSEVGPKDESIRSDLSTMGGGEDDAAAEERRMMLKLRHVSGTNFLSTLPSGYLSQPYPGPASTSSSTSSSTLNNSIPFSSTSSEYQFSTSSRSASRPSVSTSSDGKSTPATPSFNSLLSSSSSNWVSSSAYASSESSSSIAASPLPVTPHSGVTGTMAHQQQMSMMSLVSPTPTQSSFLSSPGRTPQPQFVDVRSAGGAGDSGGMMSMSNVITSLQEELAATRKQMRQQALDMERMKDELEALRKEKEETKTVVCRGCGERDGAPRGASSDSASDASEKRLTGVLNRPRAPTGSGGRFGTRMI